MAINYPQSLTPGSVVVWDSDPVPKTVVVTFTAAANARSSYTYKISESDKVKFSDGNFLCNTSYWWQKITLVSGQGS